MKVMTKSLQKTIIGVFFLGVIVGVVLCMLIATLGRGF